MSWGAAFQAVGNIISGGEASKDAIKEKSALKRQGIAQEKAAEFTAGLTEQQAGQALAAAQREAAEELRMSEVMQSKALALAGASGAGVSDPTFMKVVDGLAAEGMMAAQAKLYQGSDAARNLRIQAALTRYEGKMARRGLNVAAKAVGEANRARQTAMAFDTASTLTSAWEKYNDRKTTDNTET